MENFRIPAQVNSHPPWKIKQKIHFLSEYFEFSRAFPSVNKVVSSIYPLTYLIKTTLLHNEVHWQMAFQWLSSLYLISSNYSHYGQMNVSQMNLVSNLQKMILVKTERMWKMLQKSDQSRRSLLFLDTFAATFLIFQLGWVKIMEKSANNGEILLVTSS